jgi:hypothetical protein
MSRPAAVADPRLLKRPDSPLVEDDPAYVERSVDASVLAVAGMPGVTLVIKAPHQSGKTSLLVRYLSRCKSFEKHDALVDFQVFGRTQLDNLAACLTSFARVILRELALDPALHRPLAAPLELTDFMEDVVLGKATRPISLGLDEVDRLLECEWREDFFGMLRHWHERRARKSEWRRLDLAMVLATEPSLLISNPAQSPFNVVTPVRLPPFSAIELRRLNAAHGDLLDRAALQALLELTGGHPFLARTAFFYCLTEGVSFKAFRDSAADEGGPYGDHLRARLSELIRHPNLAEA